jgi:hypothetical protein
MGQTQEPRVSTLDNVKNVYSKYDADIVPQQLTAKRLAKLDDVAFVGCSLFILTFFSCYFFKFSFD